MSDNRRTFVRQILALTSVSVGQGKRQAQSNHNEGSEQPDRISPADRQNAVLVESFQPIVDHVDNGDESAFPTFIASFTKGLPHTQLGEIEPGAYETLLYALSRGKHSDFESIARGRA